MSSIPAVDIEASENYTDVLCHGTGVTQLEFSNPIPRLVKRVSKAELIAYDIPCRKNTVDASNDRLDFEVGPEIGRVFVTDAGQGYDRFNPPTLHVVNYRSVITGEKEKVGPRNSRSYYPPWNNRSVSGIKIRQRNYASPSVNPDLQTAAVKYNEAGVEYEPQQVDRISFGCDINNTHLAFTDAQGNVTTQKATQCYMVRSASLMDEKAVIEVDRPFDYPYHLHLCRNVVSTATTTDGTTTEIIAGQFAKDKPRIFSDKIKLYRAFYRYEQYVLEHGENIDVLGTQIAMEINYVLGWDVRHNALNEQDNLNDGHFPDDDEYRWHPEFQATCLTKIGEWTESLRYQVRYHNSNFMFVDLFNEPFSLGSSFESGALIEQKKYVFTTGFLNMDADQRGLYLEQFLCFGGLYPCVTTLFGILGFATQSHVPALSDNISYTMFSGATATLYGYASEKSGREVLKVHYNMYRSARPAILRPSVHKCTAHIRHGVYAIGNVLQQSYRRSAQNNSEAKPSYEINVRQAADGLLKEIQDQMNLAFHGPGLAVAVGDVNNIVKAHEMRQHALHYPLMNGSSFSNTATIFDGRLSPHKFVVTLEDADVYDGEQPQSATNLRSNQNRKTRVRISFSEQHNQPLKYRTTLRLLNRTGPNSSRSITSMLGFSTQDITDQQFMCYVSQANNANPDADPNYANLTVPRYMYGVQAQSTFDTAVRSKSCRIEIGINQNSSFTPLAVAMVAGRTDHANTTCNTDGSVQSYLNEQQRLSGFNRYLEIESDPTRSTVFAEPSVGAAVAPYIKPVSQNNLNTPVFRSVDWGVRPVTLDRRYNVTELFFRVLDGRHSLLWPCNASETTLFFVRLHHPVLEEDARKKNENREFM